MLATIRHMSLLGFGGDVLLFSKCIFSRTPLRFAEDRESEVMKSNIPQMFAAQSAFPSGPLLGFHRIFDQLIWR